MIYELRFSVTGAPEDYLPLRSILFKVAKFRKIRCCENIIKQDYRFIFESRQQEALEFCDEIAKRIPLSLFFNFLSFESVEEQKFRAKIPKIPPVIDALEIAQIVETKDLDALKKWLVDFTCQGAGDFDSILQNCLDLLKKDALCIQTSRGNFQLTLHQSHSDNKVVFWDISGLKTYMRIDSAQIKALASYEKPSMSLMPKEAFYNILGDEHRECLLPFDIFLSVLAKYCLESGIDFAFIAPSKEAPCLSYHQILPKPHSITLSQNGYVIFHQIQARDLKSIILAHKEELESVSKDERLKSHALIMGLSREHETLFWLKEDRGLKSILECSLECAPAVLLQEVLQTTHGDRLCANFAAHFPKLFEKAGSHALKSRKTKNLFEFLDAVALILGFDDANHLLKNARKYVRDKGPRIDYKLEKSPQNVLYFDYIRVLKSAMSFRIAGIDEATLCYGILDSMGEFLGNFIGDMSVNFNAKRLFLFGSLLKEKIILDKILHYMPKDVDLILPKNGFLDYR